MLQTVTRTPEVVQNLQQTLRARVLRYIERHGRLAPIDERTVAYELRKPTHDGRTCLLLDPLELMARLASVGDTQGCSTNHMLIARIYGDFCRPRSLGAKR